jgi:hypothetical protein
MTIALSRPGMELGAGADDALIIEQYGGEVEGTFAKMSFMREYATIKTIRGTNMVTNDRIGKSTLTTVTPGVRPDAAVVQFDNVSVKVDTIVLARANTVLLDDFTQHYNVRAELGNEHGKEIAKFFDESFIIQAIKCAGIVAGDGTGGTTKLPPGWFGGTVIPLTTALDENDPIKLLAGIKAACKAIEKKDVDLDGAVIICTVDAYYTLEENDKLIDARYSQGNGDYAEGTVLKANGIRIVKTNRIPSAAITGHKLSNAGNSNAYDVTATEAKTVAIVLLPKALLAGELIPLTSKVHYSDIELQWFIDSYLSYGVTANRAEHCAIVRKA